ncbi:unnamed protein product [Danaus chrysippus]|uniref:(African queen) hypothetical protein n=1 Tax=Danaus chrysippus TaxID=151541 RepID=A0A8J2W550_9NEOP|nr:unnamed protein product [Danaus chrysippus]
MENASDCSKSGNKKHQLIILCMGGSHSGPTRVLTPSPFVIGPGLLPGVSLGHGVASGAPAVHRNGYGMIWPSCMMGTGYMPYAGFYGTNQYHSSTAHV